MSEYIVVIEVDNKRAAAAYQKGLADLELIWPQLMERAASIDAKRRADYEKRKEKAEKDDREARDARQRYETAMEVWRAKSLMFRGPAPEYPGCGMLLPSSLYVNPPSSLRSLYESVRHELQQKFNLAEAAISSFRMPEYEVQRMIAWEDGSRVEGLKKYDVMEMPFFFPV
jgi:hypothetical protein